MPLTQKVGGSTLKTIIYVLLYIDLNGNQSSDLCCKLGLYGTMSGNLDELHQIGKHAILNHPDEIKSYRIYELIYQYPQD